MSTIKSSSEHLTINADGALKDIILQNNGSTKVTVKSDGKLGVGTSSPETNMHIFKGESGLAGAGEDIGLTIENNADTGIQMISPNTANNWIMFGDPEDKNVGRIQYSHSADTLTFYTSDNPRVSILSGGGLTFNGDTAAANALDDYEEGTWSATLKFGGGVTGITYSTQTGWYTKIGNTVTVWGVIVLTNKGTSTGTAYITGLPFAPAAGSGNNQFGSFAIANGMASMPQTNTWVMPHSSTNMYLRYQTTTGEGNLTDTNFSNTSNFGWTATYKV